MDLLATLRRSGGIDALARQLALPPARVFAGVEALLPALLDGLREYARRLGGDGEAGMSALLAMIDGFGNGNLAADVMGPEPLIGNSGERMLVQFFDDPDAKRQLADEVAAVSGQAAAVLEQILPLLTMLVSGYISARAEANGTHSEGLRWLRELLMLREGDEPRAGFGTSG